MAEHLIDGEFQSDKYPTTPRGKVPLSCKDKTAQDLLWAYAQRRRVVDEAFSADLEQALILAGFQPSEPEIEDFVTGIRREADHQRERWGEAHDRDKSAENWFWLVGYLTGKALRANIEGDIAKALHHTISAAVALSQWHRAILLDRSGRGIGGDADIDPEVGRLDAEPTGSNRINMSKGNAQT